MRLNIVVLLMISLLIAHYAQGQSTSSTIAGKIIEQSTKEPMEFVNVSLHNASDSSIAAGIITDKNGVFKFTEISKGNYYLRISFIGFETIKTPVFTISAGTKVDKGIIPIKASSYVLGDVSVKAEKSILETSIDRKIYNVGSDITSTSGSASQILENVPSISVGIDGTVSLRGLSNVTILINGKPSSMMRVNSAEALQQIPASSIERVEVITNPSAKYKPDGTAGIINIVLKKEIKEGLNGAFTANAGNDERYNTMLMLNYKPGKVNFFGSYGFRQDNRTRTETDFRRVNDSVGNLTSIYNYVNTALYRPKSHTANIGADYIINKNNEIGISGNYFERGFLRTENASTTICDNNEIITDDYNRDRLDDEYEYDKELSGHYEHKFKKEDHNLLFEFNLADHFEKEDNKFTETYRVPAMSNTYDNTLIRQWEKSGDATVEYVNPITEDIELETGYSAEWINQDFDFFGEYFNTTQNAWIKDIGKSNRFLFEQQIHALYATYSQSIEDFGFMAGLRGEQAYTTSRLVTLDSVMHNDYFKLYPTIHLSYELSSKEELQLSYSKRVNRPEGDEMNPFPEYDDPRNIFRGNPFIKPEQIHSVEFGYQFKNDTFTFVPSIYYRYMYDGFAEISRYINDSVLLTTFENLSKEQSAGLELIFSWRLKKIMTMNLTGSLFYSEIDASNLGYSGMKSTITGNFKLGATINITKTTAMQINANYFSAGLTPQGKYLPRYYLNTGLRQNLFKNKASLLLTVSDVFNTMRWVGEISTPELYQKTTGKRKSQIIYLGFTYRFGKSNKKNGEELKFDEKM
ncbi:MAG: TonB-dependent receptor [Bacteroidales bacterium]|nr:TonB-dependent receptor [Bacteroidales bacterium]